MVITKIAFSLCVEVMCFFNLFKQIKDDECKTIAY